MSILEITGFIFGVTGVWLIIKKNMWCFPVGIVNVVITAWLVFEQHLYADVLQQLVYLALLIYGWVEWSTGKIQSDKEITAVEKRHWAFLMLIFISFSIILGYLLKTYTIAAYPYADSTGTIICFIAQWMVAVKKIENWYLWIVANIMYVVIYFLKDLPLYSVLSGIYLIMAFIGLIEWRKIMASQKV